MNDDLPRVYYPLSVLGDLMPELREQERARKAGITYDAVRAILADWRLDDGDSFGRTIERLRSLTLEAAARMAEEESHQLRLMTEEAAHAENLNAADLLQAVAEIERLRAQRRLDNAEAARLYDFARDKGQAQERAAVVAWLRGRQEAAEWALTAAGYEHAADAIERGEHRREEGT
jgi:hypothetical protein